MIWTMNTKIYYYAKPKAMEGHRFSDDVAICLASSISEAIRKFQNLYSDASKDNASLCNMNKYGVAILTDY